MKSMFILIDFNVRLSRMLSRKSEIIFILCCILLCVINWVLNLQDTVVSTQYRETFSISLFLVNISSCISWGEFVTCTRRSALLLSVILAGISGNLHCILELKASLKWSVVLINICSDEIRFDIVAHKYTVNSMLCGFVYLGFLVLSRFY